MKTNSKTLRASNIRLIVKASSLPTRFKARSALTAARILPASQGITTVCLLGMNLCVGQLLAASELDSWAVRPSGITKQLNGVAFGGDQFVAAGSAGIILTSPDGVHWTVRSSGATNDLAAVTFANNNYVAVGAGGVVLTSPDAVAWSRQNSGTTSDLRDVAYGANTFIAVGSSERRSYDGTNWTSQPLPHPNPGQPVCGLIFSSIVFDKNLFMILGKYRGCDFGWFPVSYTSDDGINWTRHLISGGEDVAFGNDLFVAVPGSYVSTNGTSWTGPSTTSSHSAVAFGQGIFVGAGWGGQIATSTNGIDWTARNSGTTGNLSSVTFGLNSFVAVGSGGLIVQSPGLPAIHVQPHDQHTPIGRTATFSVIASGSSPLRYQWNKDGGDIEGATNATLSISSVQSNHFGGYSVVVSNAYGSVTSRVAILELGVIPVFIQQPLSQSVVVGGSVTLSAEITGDPTPFDYEWRKVLPPLITNRFESNERRSFFTLTNVQGSHAGTYRLVVRNAAWTNGVSSSTVTLTVLTDADGNGLPDTWESAYPTATDPATDTDNDGRSNLDEYRAGTHPTNAASVLRIDRITTGNPTTLEFEAVSNKTYTVQHTDSVAGGSWFKLADLVARTNNRTETVLDAGAGANRYYRLVTPRQP